MMKILTLLCIVLLSTTAMGSTSYRAKKAKTRRPPTAAAPVTKPPAPELTPIYNAVSFYVGSKSPNGSFLHPEPLVEGQSWALLALDERPQFKKISSDRYRVRARFMGSLGTDPAEHEVAVDFFLRGSGERWRVDRTNIHSVNGNVRPGSLD